MASKERQTILFVADQPEQYGLRLVVENAGYAMSFRNTLVSGLQFLIAQKADAVVVDAAVESGRGLDLVGAVRNDDKLKNLPVIVLAKDDRQAAVCVQAFAAGADEFIQVPFLPAVCLARIGRLVKRSVKEAIGASLSVQVTPKELPGIMQYIEAELKTGKLNIVSQDKTATIFFKEGRLVNAAAPEYEGLDVITEVLCWPSSQVTFVETPLDPKDLKFETQVTGVIMNCAVGVDEYHDVRRTLPAEDVMFWPGQPLPADAAEPQRQILLAALQGYSVSDLLHGVHPSERKATLWLHELIEKGHLVVGTTAFADYASSCRKHYRNSYLTGRLSTLRTILADVPFPLELPPGFVSMGMADWLSPVPKLMLVGDNAEHLTLFMKSLGQIYTATINKQPAERRYGRSVMVSRLDFGNKAVIDVVALPLVNDPAFGGNLEEYLQDAFAVIQFEWAHDQETSRHARRVHRLLRQRFGGVVYNVVPRVPSPDGKFMFKINCVHCGFKLAVDMEEAGFTGECPVCNQTIAIPNSMDNLANVMQLPDDVPVVTIEPGQALHCRDLLLMVLDNVLTYCAHTQQVPSSGSDSKSGVRELHKVKKTQIEVAETQMMRMPGPGPGMSVEPVASDYLPPGAQGQPAPGVAYDPAAFAPLPQEEEVPEEQPQVNEILSLLAQEKPREQAPLDLNALLHGDDEENIDDLINRRPQDRR